MSDILSTAKWHLDAQMSLFSRLFGWSQQESSLEFILDEPDDEQMFSIIPYTDLILEKRLFHDADNIVFLGSYKNSAGIF